MAQPTDTHLSHRQHSQLRVADAASWAQGDFAVHPLALATPLIDGRAAMLAMCVAFLRARKTIWLADWSMYARLKLVRGRDQCAGPDGSEAQNTLLDTLRAAGLDDEAIALWQADQLALVDVLGNAVRRGVDVRVLLWDPLDPWNLGHLGNDPDEQARIFAAQDVPFRLDKNCRSVFHLVQGLHQKCATVDGEVAFVGGVDFTVEYSGDFDRWDTPKHLFSSPLRATDRGDSPHPWHDAQIMITGDAVRDVEENLRQRWDASSGRVQQRIQPLREILQGIQGAIRNDRRLLRARKTSNTSTAARIAAPAGTARIQVVRTIPALTYRFAPGGIYGIAEAYLEAVRRAERLIYLESQYLWVEGPPLLKFTRLGWESRKMRELARELAAAAERGVHIVLVLPDHPNVGRAVTDRTIAWVAAHAPHAVAEHRLRCYTLATHAPDGEGNMRYRPVYVHAKVAVIDDHWATVGSANLNSRGMSHDAEMNVVIEDADFAHSLRRILWSEHTSTPLPAEMAWPMGNLERPNATSQASGTEIARDIMTLARAMPGALAALPSASASAAPESSTAMDARTAAAGSAQLADVDTGLRMLAQLADDNLRRLRQGEPLTGHLLPYLRAAEGSTLGLRVERHRGLLDPLRAVREGVEVPHVNRYV